MKVDAVFVFFGPSIVSFQRAARVLLSSLPSGPVDAKLLQLAELEFQQAVSAHIVPYNEGFAPQDNWADFFIQLVLSLQTICRHPPQRSLGQRQLGPDRVEIAFSVAKEQGCSDLVHCAAAFIELLLGQEDEQRQYFLARLQKLGHKARFSLGSLFLYDRLKVANLLAVPIQHETGSRYFIGQGKHTQILGVGRTTQTTAMGKELSGDKARTTSILSECGLPAPRQLAADNENQAVKLAQAIGFPVVVKPRWGSKGRAVSVNLNSEQEVRDAFQQSAQKVGEDVVVETFLPGEDHRLLVVGDRMVAAVKRIPAAVCGDGEHSVQELMQLDNDRQRRDGLYLFPLVEDAEVTRILAGQGLSVSAIPAKGQQVWLRKAANQSLGGTTLDVTDLIHPDNCAMAVAAAKAVFLDVAGIDFVTEDISQSWRQGGGIVEVNAYPGVDLHMCPTTGKAREVAWSMLRATLARDLGRIPVIMLLGTQQITVANALERVLSMTGLRVGLWHEQGRFINGYAQPMLTAKADIRQLFTNASIDAAVFTQSLADLAREGAPVDSTAITVLLQESDATELEQTLYDAQIADRLHQLGAQLATHAVVMDAALSFAEVVARALPAQHLILLVHEAALSLSWVQQHLQAGGRMVRVLRQGTATRLLYETRAQQQTVLLLNDGDDADYIQALLTGLAVLLGLGYDLAYASKALQQLHAVAAVAPSAIRTLVGLGTQPVQVLHSYQPAVLPELQGYLARLPVPARRLVFIETPVQDLQALLTSVYSEQTWLFCDAQVAQQLAQSAIPTHKLLCAPHADAALAVMLAQATADDQLLILAADTSANHAVIQSRLAAPKPAMPASTVHYWNSAILAQVFAGQWIAGLNHAEFARIAHADEADLNGALVLIPERYQEEQLETIQAKISQARARGAVGIIASMTVPEFPRHYPVLIADDPYLGLQQLAQQVRGKLQAKLVACLGRDEQAVLPAIIANKQQALGAAGGLVQVASLPTGEAAYLSLLLQLVNLSPLCPWALLHSEQVPAGWWYLQPDEVLLFDTLLTDELLQQLTALCPASKITVLYAPTRAAEVQACLARYPSATLTALALDSYRVEFVATSAG